MGTRNSKTSTPRSNKTKPGGAKAKSKVPKMSKAASQLLDAVLQYDCASKGASLTLCPALSEKLKAMVLRWPGIEWMPLTPADRQTIDQNALRNLLEFRIEEVTPDGRRVPIPDDEERVGAPVLITTRLIDRVEVVLVN